MKTTGFGVLIGLTGVTSGCCCVGGNSEPPSSQPATLEEVPPPSPPSSSPSPPPPVEDTAEVTVEVAASLPQITDAVGLGDSFRSFRERHGPCTGPAASPLELDAEGTAALVFCDQLFYMLSSMYGVVQSLTLQYEARGNLP